MTLSNVRSYATFEPLGTEVVDHQDHFLKIGFGALAVQFCTNLLQSTPAYHWMVCNL